MPRNQVKSPFQNLDRFIEQHRLEGFYKSRALTDKIFQYIKGNVIPPETTKWDKGRKSGREEPGIYAEPPEMLIGEVDAFHGGGLMKSFNMKKVGSGEGAQYFGYGGYFSERKGVAEHYFRQYQRKYGGKERIIDLDTNRFKKLVKDEIEEVLSPEQTKEFLESKYFKNAQTKIEHQIKELRRAQGSKPAPKTAKKIINDRIKNEMKLALVDASKSWDLNTGQIADLGVYKSSSIADTLTKKIIKEKPSAGLYKSKLWEGHKENLIDWDKRVPEEKAEQIAEAMNREKIFERPAPKEVYRQFEEGLITRDEFINKISPKKEYVEKQKGIYKEWFSKRGDITYKTISRMLGSDKKASEFLNRAGIDGIRYPVGTLSGGGNGYNYVVFDEKSINLKRIK